MQPIKTPHTNKIFKGYDPQEKGLVTATKVNDLCLTDDGEGLNSVWKCNNIWERIKFLFDGKITLRILSRKQPAVSLLVGDVVEDKILQTFTLFHDDNNPLWTLCPGHVDAKTFNKRFNNEGWEGDGALPEDLKYEYAIREGVRFRKANEGDPGAEPFTIMEW